MKQTIAFIGLGNMGANIAETAAEAASHADFVITMVPNLPQIEESVFGAEGIAQTAKPGTILINMSTVSPNGIQSLSAKLKDRGIFVCDAPGKWRTVRGK